jgi:hypothetical protein
MSKADLEALEALVVDNSDLERLETMLDQFNMFEAMGAVRREVRHSDFLAVLLKIYREADQPRQEGCPLRVYPHEEGGP